MRHTLTLALILGSSACFGQVYYQGPRMNLMQAEAAALQSQAALNWQQARIAEYSFYSGAYNQRPQIIVQQVAPRQPARRTARTYSSRTSDTPAPVQMSYGRTYTHTPSWEPKPTPKGLRIVQTVFGVSVFAVGVWGWGSLAIDAWKYHKSRQKGAKR